MDSDENAFEANVPYQKRRNNSDQEYQQNDASEHSNQSYSQQDSQDDAEQSEFQKIQRQILQKAVQKEKKIPYQQQITNELFQKISKLKSSARNKSGQQLVNIKIQELSYNKLLVLNYNKADFRMIMAHYYLGQAYLKFECLEQAIQHINVALHKNQKIFQDIPKARIIQIYMYNTLAQTFMTNHSYDEALEALNNAGNVQQIYNSILSQHFRAERKDLIKNLKLLILKAQCLCKQKQFDDAIQAIQQVIQETSSQQRRIQKAFALVDKANIYAQMKSHDKYLKAIENQEEAIKILVNLNYEKPQQVAQLYQNLSVFYEHIGNPENSLNCIQKVKTLYEQIYTPQDKKVIKTRRRIATALLKSQRYKQAVNELLEISKLQQKIFGQSVQLARTLKLLGTVYISLQIGDARVYLKRSMNIFTNLGNKKQANQIKQKLKSLGEVRGHHEINIISENDI